MLPILDDRTLPLSVTDWVRIEISRRDEVSSLTRLTTSLVLGSCNIELLSDSLVLRFVSYLSERCVFAKAQQPKHL